MKIRSSGILLHISSLPARFGIGDLGPSAYKFVDFLAAAGHRYWQILPLNPTEAAYGHSPYHSPSAFAGNPLFISLQFLEEEGLLSKNDLRDGPRFHRGKVFYEKAGRFRMGLLSRAYKQFRRKRFNIDFESFCDQNSHWLEDFSLFTGLSARFHSKQWNAWPVPLRDRRPEALKKAKKDLSEWIHWIKFVQYIFYRQWTALKSYCRDKGIQIIGDMPIYVPYNSADLWTHPAYFRLDKEKLPEAVSGVPPDYFSVTGQLWKNPIYEWNRLKENHYDWWIQRISHILGLVDFVRIDHFRGLVSYWEVPAHEENAVNGRWVEAPVVDFLETVFKKFPHSSFIAEDLGFITADVREIVRRFHLPGMRVLLFAFFDSSPTSTHVLHNHIRNCVVYTGTHDNNTARGWFETEAGPETKRYLYEYLGKRVRAGDVSKELIRLAMMSQANTVIVPMQDILNLDAAARMNHPSTPKGNWQWRLRPGQLSKDVSDWLLRMNYIYGRK